MDTLLLNLLIGISFGFILFLLGTGLTLTMGLMRIVNLAHGAIYMVGGYAGLTVARYTHNFLLGILAAGICAGLIGLIMETAFLRRLYKRELSQVLLTIGFIYILTNIAQWIWGTIPQSGVVPEFLSGSIPIAGIKLPMFRIGVIVFGLLAALALWLFQDKTRTGAIIRAGMDNKEVTSALGINLKLVFTAVFALGTLIAGFSGLMGAPLMGIDLAAGWDTLLLAMMVVIVGGTGSIQGALAGGLLMGLVDSFGKAYFPSMAYFTMYLVLVIVLLFRPSGLLGRARLIQSSQQTSPTASSLNARYISAMKAPLNSNGTVWRAKFLSFLPYVAGILILIVLGLPKLLPAYFLSMLTQVIIYAIFAISLDLVLGYTGLISLGHAAFLGVAGYTVGIFMVRYGIDSFWLLMPLGIVASGIAAAIIGYFVLRVSGIYFLLVTLAFGQLLYVAAIQWRSITGGSSGLVGISHPNLGPPGFALTASGYYYLVFIVFVICFFLLLRISNSPFGKALVGIRENEQRMQSLGYNIWKLKYFAYILGGLFAGVSGVLLASFFGIIVPSNLAVTSSTSATLMVIIGGAGTLFGPVLGSFIVVILERVTSAYTPDRWPLVLGAIFVMCVMFVRGGFAIYLSNFWKRVRIRYSAPRIDEAGSVNQ